VETVVFAHGDCDGVTSAAIAYSVFGGRVVFSHPVGLLGDLEEFADQAERVVVLDISLDERTWRGVAEKLSAFREAIYIDHHPPPEGGLELLEKLGVRVFHEQGPSTAELAFRHLNPPRELSRVALYGAIGDYAVRTEWFNTHLGFWDIRALYLEAGVLTLGLEGLRRDHDRKRELVAELAVNRLPSSIDFLVSTALREAKNLEEARRALPSKLVVLKSIAYVVNPGAPLGAMATFSHVQSGRPVGLAIEVKRDWAVMSLRSASGCVDLNALLRELAPRYEGHGGGHREAAGARVPVARLEGFLAELDEAVSRICSQQR